MYYTVCISHGWLYTIYEMLCCVCAVFAMISCVVHGVLSFNDLLFQHYLLIGCKKRKLTVLNLTIRS